MTLRVSSLVLPLILCASNAGAAAAIEPEMPRLRPATRRAQSLIDTALRDSPTVREQAAVIAASDLIVFVEFARIDDGARAMTRLVTVTPHARFVRVTLDALTPIFDQIPLLAHELQHAVELARAPAVRDTAAMRQLYARIGINPGQAHMFETLDARLAERQARRERAKGPG
jgi:hypothetical protein